MHEKAKDAIDVYLRKGMSRRELTKRLGAIGLTAASANTLFGLASTRALAQDYDWQATSGTTVNLLLNKHPYTDAMIANIQAFKDLTGMDVKYDVFPEDVYFDKVTAMLSSGSSQYDAFMTGAYQTWQYGPAGWLEDMNEHIPNAAPNYNWEDILPNLRDATSWSGQPGAPLGGEGSKQWAMPWGFELNSVSYNRRMFEEAGLEPPSSLPDMIEKANKLQTDVGGIYGVGVRGSRSWATIHPGYLSGFTNYGASDFVMNDGVLDAAMNSAEGKEFTRLWVQMIKEAGPRNWSTYTWYEVGNDLGAGASAMIYDADILGYFMNGGTQEAGNLAYTAFAPHPDKTEPTPNVWIWSLAMNANSPQKDAAWRWMQWATGAEHALFGARQMDFVNPVRQSVWDDEEFRNRIDESYPGYLKQYEASAPGSKIYFTPQPLFFNLTTEWASSLQQMVADQVGVDEGLDQLAESVNRQLSQAGMR